MIRHMTKQRVLDVNSFIHSRNFEIRSFEQSQLNSKMHHQQEYSKIYQEH